MVKHWLSLVLLLLCCTGVRAQPATLSVYNNGEYALTDYLSFYEDKSNALTFRQVMDASSEDRFKTLSNRYLTFGLTQSTLWFKLKLRYPNGAPNHLASKTFYYEVARAHLDIAELHIVRADGRVDTIASDVRQPLSEKPVVHINSVFPFEMALGEDVTLYLRVQNRTGTFLPQTLWTPDAFAAKVSHEEYFYGVFYGGMMVMLVYNLLLYCSSRNNTYFYYSGYLLGVMLFEFVDIGHGFTLFKEDYLILHKEYIPFFFWVLWLVGMRYTQHYLEIRERHPAINYAVNAYYFLSFICLLIALEYNYYATVQFIAHFGGTAVLLVLGLSIYIWYKGNANAEFFTYAWAFNMLGFALYSSVVVGLSPAHPLLLFAMPIGTLLEAVVLSLALADRIKRAEKQKIDANDRAIENLSLYRSVFDNAVEGLYQMSLTGRLLNVNHAFSRMLGYATPAMALQDSRFAVGHLFPDPERLRTQLANEGMLNEEIRAQAANGIDLNALHYATLVRNSDGTPVHIEGKLTDLRDRRERERAQHERLQERRAKEVATRATHAKSEFLQHMSYEIRTPLAAIIGFSESLRENLLSQFEKRSAIAAITENSHKLLQLINNILDYSKIEANKLALETMDVDLAAVLHQLQTQLQAPLTEKRLAFTFEVLPPVPSHIMTDPTRLQQILLNLCNNAIKYTDQGKITVKLSWDGVRARLRLDVVDSGQGILPELLQRVRRSLSDRYYSQAPQGLGLTIANQLARLMGGELTIDSVPGKGCTVTVELPATQGSDTHWITQALAPYKPHPPLQNIPQLMGRVLVAEDNAVNQKLIQRIVSKTGADLVIVSDGKQALEAASATPFDLVLMDINMPVMDGLEATRALRASGYVRPIYALTAETGQQEIGECIAAGCNGYLAKPLELVPFYAILAECLPRRDASPSSGGALA